MLKVRDKMLKLLDGDKVSRLGHFLELGVQRFLTFQDDLANPRWKYFISSLFDIRLKFKTEFLCSNTLRCECCVR